MTQTMGNFIPYNFSPVKKSGIKNLVDSRPLLTLRRNQGYLNMQLFRMVGRHKYVEPYLDAKAKTLLLVFKDEQTGNALKLDSSAQVFSAGSLTRSIEANIGKIPLPRKFRAEKFEGVSANAYIFDLNKPIKFTGR